MKVSVDELGSLPGHRISIDFNENLALAEVVKPCVGALFLGPASGGYRLNGTVTTLLKLSCHNCLRPYFQQLSVEVDELFVRKPNYKEEFEMGAPRDRELLKNDFYDEVSEDGFIDISDVVYQAVTLASPVFCRCGADCPGPPRPGDSSTAGDSGSQASDVKRDKPIDPRWKNLKTLFPNQE